jgi:hypothetical protein
MPRCVRHRSGRHWKNQCVQPRLSTRARGTVSTRPEVPQQGGGHQHLGCQIGPPPEGGVKLTAEVAPAVLLWNFAIPSAHGGSAERGP